jgi:hypothetical protein
MHMFYPGPQLNLDSCLRIIPVVFQDQESATSGAWLKPAGGILILVAPETLLRTLLELYFIPTEVGSRNVRYDELTEAQSDRLTTAANAHSCSKCYGEPSARRQIKSLLIMT